MNQVKSSNSRRLACTTGNVSNNSNNQSNSNNCNGNNSSSSSASSLSSGSGMILKKLTADSSEQENSRTSLPNISNTLEHIVQQLDILTQVCEFLDFNKKIGFGFKIRFHELEFSSSYFP